MDCSRSIEALYSPELIRKCGQMLIELASEYMETCQTEEVSCSKWQSPEDITKKAALLLEKKLSQEFPINGLVERFQEIAVPALTHSRRLYGRHYMGHQVPPPLPIATWFDAIGSLTNQSAAIYEMGPYTSAVEKVLGAELLKLVGWSAESGGAVFMNGGSLANLTGLLAARNIRYGDLWKKGFGALPKKPALICSADAHYSISRAAGILGIGTDQVLSCSLDERRRMVPQALASMVEEAKQSGLDIFCVVASSGSTSVGAMDPLDDIAEICTHHGIWLHVDGAHGASLLLSKKHKSLLNGIERADSLVWDAHKLMFVPSTSTMLLYRNQLHSFQVFSQDAPYLFDKKNNNTADFDGALRTVECTKHANAYGLWGVWAVLGPELLSELINTCVDNAQILYRHLNQAEDFEVCHTPQCNILCFRYLPPFLVDGSTAEQTTYQKCLRSRLVESGNFYITLTSLDGKAYLRVALMNPMIREADLIALMNEIRRVGCDQT